MFGLTRGVARMAGLGDLGVRSGLVGNLGGRIGWRIGAGDVVDLGSDLGGKLGCKFGCNFGCKFGCKFGCNLGGTLGCIFGLPAGSEEKKECREWLRPTSLVWLIFKGLGGLKDWVCLGGILEFWGAASG